MAAVWNFKIWISQPAYKVMWLAWCLWEGFSLLYQDFMVWLAVLPLSLRKKAFLTSFNYHGQPLRFRSKKSQPNHKIWIEETETFPKTPRKPHNFVSWLRYSNFTFSNGRPLKNRPFCPKLQNIFLLALSLIYKIA